MFGGGYTVVDPAWPCAQRVCSDEGAFEVVALTRNLRLIWRYRLQSWVSGKDVGQHRFCVHVSSFRRSALSVREKPTT